MELLLPCWMDYEGKIMPAFLQQFQGTVYMKSKLNRNDTDTVPFYWYLNAVLLKEFTPFSDFTLWMQRPKIQTFPI